MRSYARLDVSLQPGIVLVTGANGVGKTNLLEALHVGTQGFSPRTRRDAVLVRRGAERGRIAISGSRAQAPLGVEVTLGLHEPKRARLNGAPLRSPEQLRVQLTTLVFTPDRLAVVKGGPAVRRAYLDRTIGRLLPARAELPLEYAAAVGQRNACLRRIAAGSSSTAALKPWTERVVDLGAALTAARLEAAGILAPRLADVGQALGLPDAALGYEPEPVTIDALEALLPRDLDRGTTGLGPHLDEIEIRSGERELRQYGSQGEQRLAVLALLLAEWEAVWEQRGAPPLLLLDDVLSELDADRRLGLARRVGAGGQTLITATAAELLPVTPSQLLRIANGTVAEDA